MPRSSYDGPDHFVGKFNRHPWKSRHTIYHHSISLVYHNISDTVICLISSHYISYINHYIISLTNSTIPTHLIISSNSLYVLLGAPEPRGESSERAGGWWESDKLKQGDINPWNLFCWHILAMLGSVCRDFSTHYLVKLESSYLCNDKKMSVQQRFFLLRWLSNKTQCQNLLNLSSHTSFLKSVTLWHLSMCEQWRLFLCCSNCERCCDHWWFSKNDHLQLTCASL